MKYKQVGNCPYCDSERGITTPWGMSPQGWADLKDRHDAGHPENVPQEQIGGECGHKRKKYYKRNDGVDYDMCLDCHMIFNPEPKEKSPKEGWSNYLKRLDEICKLSKIGYCPGCGITPEALESLLAQERAAASKEQFAKARKLILSHSAWIPKEVVARLLDVLPTNKK